MNQRIQHWLIWICGLKVKEQVTTTELYKRLNMCHLHKMLRYNRLRWARHVHRSALWTNRCQNLEVAGRRGRGRPSKAWKAVLTEDLRTCGLPINLVEDRKEWRR